jgi:hypothetical protein
MTSQDANGVQIDRVHSDAICMEIGERLCATLAGNPTQLPPHLLGLAELFDTAVHGDAAFNHSIRIGLR